MTMRCCCGASEPAETARARYRRTGNRNPQSAAATPKTVIVAAAAGPDACRRPAPDDRDRRQAADRDAEQVDVRPVRRGAARFLVLPFLRLGHEQADEEHQQRRQRAADHQEAPARSSRAGDSTIAVGMPMPTSSASTPPMKLVQADAQQADHEESDIGRGADQSRDQRARLVRPDFVDERDAERPLAAHAERGDESQRGDVPRLGREAAQPGEDRIGEDAQRHRADAADAIAEPAEKHAAGGGADEEDRDDRAEPLSRLRRRCGPKQIVRAPARR